MSTLFPVTITVRRYAGSYVKGVWVQDALTAFTFEGSVQTMSDRELDALEIGRKDVGYVKIYASTPLQVSVEGATNSGDIVVWQSRLYEIIKSSDYQNNLIPHYKYIARYKGAA